jgi:hypothetical protein
MADATQTVTQQNAISAYAQPYVENLLGQAQALTNTPYQAYPGQRTADFTNLQNQFAVALLKPSSTRRPFDRASAQSRGTPCSLRP